MSCAAPRPTAEHAEPTYRVTGYKGDTPNRWEHEHTGLVVELFTYARHRTARATTIDHYEHRIVVDTGEERGAVARSTELPGPELAREWMDEHPDGTVDLEAERLGEWE